MYSQIWEAVLFTILLIKRRIQKKKEKERNFDSLTAKQYRHSEQWKSFVKFENGTGLKIKSSFSGLPGQYYLFVLIGNHFQKCGFLQTKRKLKCFVTLSYTNAHWRWQPCLWVTFTLGPEGVPWDVLEHTKGSKDKREEGREGAGRRPRLRADLLQIRTTLLESVNETP